MFPGCWIKHFHSDQINNSLKAGFDACQEVLEPWPKYDVFSIPYFYW